MLKKKLKNNTTCYGEMSAELRALMDTIGVRHFEVRNSWCWLSMTKYTDPEFNNCRTYRLKAEYEYKDHVKMDYVEQRGLWGVRVNGQFVTYDSSVSVVCIDGVNVQFLGYLYTPMLVLTDTMMGPNGSLPSSGVWAVVTI